MLSALRSVFSLLLDIAIPGPVETPAPETAASGAPPVAYLLPVIAAVLLIVWIIHKLHRRQRDQAAQQAEAEAAHSPEEEQE